MSGAPNPGLIRVFKIPAPTGQFCWGAGRLAPFVEVDWFQDTDDMMAREDGREAICDFIRQKRYAALGVPLLVMSPLGAFTINYTAARDPEPRGFI